MELEEKEKKAAELEASRIQSSCGVTPETGGRQESQGKSSCNKGDHGRNYQRRYT